MNLTSPQNEQGAWLNAPSPQVKRRGWDGDQADGLTAQPSPYPRDLKFAGWITQGGVDTVLMGSDALFTWGSRLPVVYCPR
jgi:hypothetical protein